MDIGHDVIFSGREARIVNRDGDMRFVADRRGDLYYIHEDITTLLAPFSYRWL